MIKLWILSALASNLNSPSFISRGKWGIFGDDIQWNFSKFVVDKNGQVVGRYYPTTSPLSLERDIHSFWEFPEGKKIISS
ncbi:hypothetical protein JHK85_002596 [Glycine max]|uniref:Glutathione peroxidase n=2 Tax=Glycine subgen. Soja TaxID=1462606 RepID=K7K572_SOYBN|nr:hypothetical protein JHK85_002596 [Glycine max]KHN25704.1 Putative glutathione peroxidase 8 [Glycine soja]